MPYMPPFIAPTRHTDPATALAQVGAIYAQQISHLRDAMRRFVAGETLPGHVRACYPFVRIHTDTVAREKVLENAGLSYGFVAGAGRFETTLTRPDLYAAVLPGAVPPAAGEPWRGAGSGHQHPADSGALFLCRA
jgi:AMP nucleosidase